MVDMGYFIEPKFLFLFVLYNLLKYQSYIYEIFFLLLYKGNAVPRNPNMISVTMETQPVTSVTPINKGLLLFFLIKFSYVYYINLMLSNK